MESSILIQVVLPLSLFLVMWGLGLSLDVSDFKLATTRPKAVLIGLGFQLLGLPLVAFAVATMFRLNPVLSVGLMIIALCPGGVTSNMFSFLARGNVALSIVLTAIVSLVTPLTIPLALNTAAGLFLGSGMEVVLPVQKTIMTLVAITVLPIVLGMMIRRRFPGFAERSDRPVRIGSIVILGLIIAGIAKQNWNHLPAYFAQVGMACALLCIASVALGYWGSRLFRMEDRDAKTIAIEVGIQNGTTGLFVASTLLASPPMAIPAAVYSLVMFVVGGGFVWLQRWNR